MRYVYSSLLTTFSLLFALTSWSFPLPSPHGGPFVIWLNEIHYDNTGTDQNEGVEVAGMAGMDLSCFQIVFYNGANGQQYSTLNLTGTIDDEGCGYGAVWFPHAPIQNGSPDGLALVYNPALCGQPGAAQVVQFLSYEGTFTAANGPAAGMTADPIPVQETANTPEGFSLQLQGFGTSYAEFYWANPSQSSYGDINPYQFFCGTPPVVFRISNTCFVPVDTVSEGVGLFPPCYWVEALNLQSGSHAVQLVLKSTTGSPADIGNFITQTFVFNPGDGPQPITIPITDDNFAEPFEFFEFALRNPTPGDLIGSDSTFAFHIADNDQSVPPSAPNVWINEFHYDNAGTDQDEGIEIAGEAGTDMACFRIVLYDQNGQSYGAPLNLSGLIDDEGCGYGAVWFPITGIQNGPNDGFALVYSPAQCGLQGQDSVYYFLSYEGPLTAVSGPADGMTAQELSVMQGSNTPDGLTLQLAGYGTTYYDFFWMGPVPHSRDQLNPQQFICSPPGAIFSIISCSVQPDTVPESAGVISTCYFVKAEALNGGPHAVQLVLTSGSAADMGNYTTQTFTFESGVTPDSLPISLTITDDPLVEGYETFVFVLRNNSPSTLIGADSTLTLLIEDNDTPAQLPNVTFDPPTYTANEGAGVVMLTLAASITPLADVTGQYVVAATSTATQGQDFTLATQTFTFLAGTTNLAINVPVTIIDDNLNEPTEKIVLKITSLTNAISPIDSAVITITDNDPLSVGFVTLTGQVDEDAGTYTVRIALNRPSVQPTSVTVSDLQGSATKPADYMFSPQTLTWPALSQDTLTVTVTIVDDMTPESDESFKLVLSNATNGASITTAEHTVVIKDNDGSSGLEENAGFSWRLYPNPASAVLFLELASPAEAFVLTDAGGRPVKNWNLSRALTHSISLENLSPGVYWARLVMADGRHGLPKLLIRY